MGEYGPDEVVVAAAGAKRLHIHFGAGDELLLTGTMTTEANQSSTCTRIVRRYVSPQLRQAAFDAAPHIATFRAATPPGMLDAAGGTIREAADAISTALEAAVPADAFLDVDDGDDGDEGDDAEMALACCRSAAWDLLQLLFIDRGHDGVVAPALVRWASTHSVILSTGVTADVSRFLPQVLHQLDVTGGRCEEPAVSQPLFWNILQLHVAKGALLAAQALLATHWLARSPPEATLSPVDLGLQVLLGQVDDVLRSASVASGGTAERDTWLLNIHLLLTNLKEQIDARAPSVRVRPADLAATLETLRIFGAAHPGIGADALENVSPSALHLFIASLAHMYPSQRADSQLAELLEHCVHCKASAPQQPAAHSLFADILRAGAANSALMLLRACAGSTLCGDWVAAHAALLLGKHGRFAEELAVLPSETGFGVSWTEFYLQRHSAALLATDSALWRPYLVTLGACPISGRAAAATALTRLPVALASGRRAVQSAAAAAERVGLLQEASALAECALLLPPVPHCAAPESAAMEALRQGRLAEALQLLPASAGAPPSHAAAAVSAAALAAVEGHAQSPAALAQGDAPLEGLQSLLARHEGSLASEGGAAPPGEVARRWVAAAAYARLLTICRELEGRRGDAAGSGEGALGLKGALSGMAVQLVAHAPPALCLYALAKLRPYATAEQACFSSTTLRTLLACLMRVTRGGRMAAVLPATTLQQLRFALVMSVTAA